MILVIGLFVNKYTIGIHLQNYNTIYNSRSRSITLVHVIGYMHNLHIQVHNYNRSQMYRILPKS